MWQGILDLLVVVVEMLILQVKVDLLDGVILLIIQQLMLTSLIRLQEDFILDGIVLQKKIHQFVKVGED